MGERNSSARKGKKAKEVTSKTIPKGKKGKVFCKNNEVKNAITEWTENGDWRSKDFGKFLKCIGVATPVNLYGPLKRTSQLNSFNCITALGEEIRISLGQKMEIAISDNCSTIAYKGTNKIRKFEPEVELRGRIIVGIDGRELKSTYSAHFYRKELMIDKSHFLEVDIEYPNDIIRSKEERLSNSLSVDLYLMGIYRVMDISEVYQNIIRRLKFTTRDIKICQKIHIYFIERSSKEKRIISEVHLQYGKPVNNE